MSKSLVLHHSQWKYVRLSFTFSTVLFSSFRRSILLRAEGQSSELCQVRQIEGHCRKVPSQQHQRWHDSTFQYDASVPSVPSHAPPAPCAATSRHVARQELWQRHGCVRSIDTSVLAGSNALYGPLIAHTSPATLSAQLFWIRTLTPPPYFGGSLNTHLTQQGSIVWIGYFFL